MTGLKSPSHQANHFRLGLAMWSHQHWQSSVYGATTKQADRLARYATIFNTVEGNTSFYATPNTQTVMNWHSATPDDFRFTFKLPQLITHQRQLQHCQQELMEFFRVMSPLAEKTGLWKIQLPAYFGPEQLTTLAHFLEMLPQGLTYGVEVRHLAFFAKGEAERALNRLLMDKQVNRIIMDSRPLFALPPASEAIIDAHKKKPQLPVHAIATANAPVVRFIGQTDGTIEALAANNDKLQIKNNDSFFKNWLQQLPLWIKEGREPYLFIHTPDNQTAPELAVRLYQQLQQQIAAEICLPTVKLHTPPLADPTAQMQLSW